MALDIYTNKGIKCKLYKGAKFALRYHSKTADTDSYRCTSRDCKSKIKINSSGEIFEYGEHNHELTGKDEAAIMLAVKCKEMVAEGGGAQLRPSEVVQLQLSSLNDASSISKKDIRLTKRAMYHRKVRLFQSLSRYFDESMVSTAFFWLHCRYLKHVCRLIPVGFVS